MSDAQLVRIILSLHAEVANLRRMVAGGMRFGIVKDVDLEAQRARVVISTAGGKDFLSPARPWAVIAGAEKSWRPVSEGQQVMMVAPHGDMRQGVILPLTFSDDKPAPSSDPGTRILSAFGEGRFLLDGDGSRAEVTASRVDLGGGAGKRVARLGDRVKIDAGSSQGFWPIVEASEKVYAE